METLLIVLFIIIILALISFITTSIYFIVYTVKSAKTEGQCNYSIYYIKTLDGDNIINADAIEQITQGYNSINKEYEIIYHLKSGHELKETFEYNNSYCCKERFDDIYRILNDLNY